ncbi:MAG: ferrous iron transport protein B [Bacteroidaceae bacterium]|nr:ferrous iron transport protein B [Prevotellaceae bacterium]MDY5632624.1 ferrous iron transport protein B [Bacteroidaceae bacterium]
MTLKDLNVGQSGRIQSVDVDGALRQHFLDLGLIPGVEVSIIKYAPMGDPIELRVHNYELTLRLDDARQIQVEPIINQPDPHTAATDDKPFSESNSIWHPGLGEDGPRFHNPQDTPVVEGTLRFALAGSQNTGKTTLFNQLTGANQHVGNFPGVTVDLKEGRIKGHPEAVVVDLPGIYSLSPYSQEERVTREYLLEHHPHGIINIVDAGNIERNLYLTLQLMELDIPMVLCLNMMDEVEASGGSIDINAMERLLGIPVIPISAKKNQGVDEVVQHALHVARYAEKPLRQDFCSPKDHGGAVHRGLHAIMHLIEDHARRAPLPVRFAASKLVEGDALVQKALQLSVNEQQTVGHILRQMTEDRGMDHQAAMAEMRFAYILNLTRRTVRHAQFDKDFERSKRIDSILTGRWTALPAFVIIMAGIFWLTFSGIGVWLQDLLQSGIDWLTAACDTLLSDWDIAPAVHRLIIDGIFGGVGSVLVFVPLIVFLFFFLSLLEDSGYMARIAFVMDGILRKIGLSGRSIVPMLLGFGCSVPAVMSSRTLPSVRDRRLTILLTPFMSCTAKVPIYAFLCAALFPAQAGWVTALLYFLGIVMAIIVAVLLKGTLLQGEAVPFVMELPNYRMPTAMNILRLMWEKGKDFLQRAFTVIFVASLVVWFLQNFSWHLDLLDESQQAESILASISGLIAPVFQPMGLGDWRIVTSLISGFMAKEAVVGTLGTLMGNAPLTSLLTPAAGAALLVFCLLYTPCVAAVATIRRELGTRWASQIVVFQCLIAYLVAWAAYGIILLFT